MIHDSNLALNVGHPIIGEEICLANGYRDFIKIPLSISCPSFSNLYFYTTGTGVAGR